MFTQTDLDRLIDAMRANGVTSLTVDTDDDALRLELAPAAAAVTSAAAPAAKTHLPAKSPCIGRFMPRGEDDGLTALKSTSNVQCGETLGYIVQRQARAIISAPVDGVLVGDIPDAETVFGFGDVVFNLEISA